MSMHVTYEVFDKNGKTIDKFNEVACFSELLTSKFDKKHSIKIQLKTTKRTEDLKEFWIDIIKEIEPSAMYGENSLTFPYKSFNSMKHLFMILTIVRLLWEPSYDEVPRMVKNIIDASPEIDKFLAVSLACSVLQGDKGWGHALVNFTMDEIKTIKDYREFNLPQINDLFKKSTTIDKSYSAIKELERLIKLKRHIYDVAPILDKFEIKYDDSKIIEYKDPPKNGK